MSFKFFITVLTLTLSPLVSSTILQLRDTPSVLSQYRNFASDGCFTDSALSVQLATSTEMTAESCIDTCSAAEFIRAGLVAGTQCWCGNVIKPESHGVDLSACSDACSGNSTEICGGDASMLEYSVRPAVVPQEVQNVGPWFVIFCAADDPILRTLHHFQEASDSMTVERCLDACLASGLAIGGLEYGRECWCGNADMYGRTGNTPLSGCTFPCAGDPTQLCGGSNRLNLYVNNVVGDVSVGPPRPVAEPGEGGPICVKDEAFLTGGPRTLPHQPRNPIGQEQMTPSLCISRCTADGWTIAGMEFSDECWCGDSFDSSLQAPDSDCNMACTDLADFTCGGANRLTVYIKE